MEVLELNGVKYSKASSIARDLGYTADYVGQLCRAGKVDAQLVGRSWYVSDESIRSHKHARYRSNKNKSVVALKESLSSTTENSAVDTATTSSTLTRSIPARVTGQHFYKKIKPAVTKYVEDQTELIPTLKERSFTGEKKVVPVEMAGSRKVTIKNLKKPYKLGATERPKIRFTGNVTIVDPVEIIDTEEKESASNKVPTKSASITEKTVEQKKHSTKNISPQVETATDRLRKQRSKLKVLDAGAKGTGVQSISVLPGKSVSMRRVSMQDQVQAGHLVVQKLEATAPKTGRATFVYITTSVFIALLLGIGVIFIEHSVTISSEGKVIDSAYSFNLSAVMDSIRP